MDKKKYVCLEGIKEGNKFYTTYEEGIDPTRLKDGSIAYRVLGYANSGDEAQRILGYGIDPEHDRQILEDSLFKTSRGLFSREECKEISYYLRYS